MRPNMWRGRAGDGEQLLLLLQGLFWLAKCPYNEEIRANTGNGQHRWWLNISNTVNMVDFDCAGWEVRSEEVISGD